jgi:hypothetical protein
MRPKLTRQVDLQTCAHREGAGRLWKLTINTPTIDFASADDQTTAER